MARYKQLQQETMIATQIDANKVIAEYANIAFANQVNLMPRKNDAGEITLDHLTDNERQVFGMNISDKIQALRDLARKLGLFETDNEQVAGTSLRLEQMELKHQELMAEMRENETIGRGKRIEEELARNPNNQAEF